MTAQTLISIPVIAKPVDGSTVSDPVTIAGTGEPGGTVDVHQVGVAAPLVSIPVNVAGNWQGQANLSKGTYSISARQKLNGSTSAWSPVKTFTVI